MSDTKSSIKSNHLSVFISCAFAGLAKEAIIVRQTEENHSKFG
jgi:hypothetical protein